jgi:hypothetical protein
MFWYPEVSTIQTLARIETTFSGFGFNVLLHIDRCAGNCGALDTRLNSTDVLSALRAHGSQQQWKPGSHFRF